MSKLPGDGSDGRAPPMFRSSLERSERTATVDAQLGRRPAGAKRRKMQAADPMQLLEEGLEKGAPACGSCVFPPFAWRSSSWRRLRRASSG